MGPQLLEFHPSDNIGLPPNQGDRDVALGNIISLIRRDLTGQATTKYGGNDVSQVLAVPPTLPCRTPAKPYGNLVCLWQRSPEGHLIRVWEVREPENRTEDVQIFAQSCDPPQSDAPRPRFWFALAWLLTGAGPALMALNASVLRTWI